VIFRKNLERLVRNLRCEVDVLIGEGKIRKVVVVVCHKYAALDHFGNPFLMQNKAVVVFNQQIEQAGFADFGFF